MSRYTVLHLPVYAKSPTRFASDRERETSNKRAAADKSWSIWGSDGAPKNVHDEIKERVHADWGSWDYNCVVGWIQAEVSQGVVELHVYEHDAKRFTRASRLRYNMISYRVDSLGSRNPLIDDAADRICRSIDYIKRSHFANRWIDKPATHALIHSIDWKKLTLASETK